MAAVKLYSAWWCGHCHRLKSQLRRADISFDEVNIENDPQASERIIAQTGGHRVIPAVAIGERLLVNPRIGEVEAALEREPASSN